MRTTKRPVIARYLLSVDSSQNPVHSLQGRTKENTRTPGEGGKLLACMGCGCSVLEYARDCSFVPDDLFCRAGNAKPAMRWSMDS